MTRTRLAQTIRIVVYAMLVLSAGTAFWFGDRLWEAARSGGLPRWAAVLPACAFTVFVLVYTIDRLLLVKRRNYPAGRAFFQIVFAVLFLALLWPEEARRIREDRSAAMGGNRAARLLRHADADVRALACEYLGTRPDLESVDDIAALAEGDNSDEVRRACARALRHLQAEAPKPPSSMGL